MHDRSELLRMAGLTAYHQKLPNPKTNPTSGLHRVMNSEMNPAMNPCSNPRSRHAQISGQIRVKIYPSQGDRKTEVKSVVKLGETKNPNDFCDKNISQLVCEAPTYSGEAPSFACPGNQMKHLILGIFEPSQDGSLVNPGSESQFF